ncbi:hypothetical protein V6N13_110143 [Hibiscus sabdariffa]
MSKIKGPVESIQDGRQSIDHLKGDNKDTMYTASTGVLEVGHEHVYLTENESFDAENLGSNEAINVLFPQSHFTFPFKSLKTPSLLPLVNPVQAFIIGSRRRLSSLLRFVTTRRSRLATTGSPLEKHGYGESITSR